MAGCLLGSVLRRDSDVATHRGRLGWAATFALGLFAAGLVTDTFEGINKIAATPTWCFYSAALACLTWMVLYLLMDVAGFTGFSILIRPAGANPLVAYFLHPITVGTVALTGLGGTLLGYRSSPDPKVVVAGSLAMACFVCGMTGPAWEGRIEGEALKRDGRPRRVSSMRLPRGSSATRQTAHGPCRPSNVRSAHPKLPVDT